MPIPPPRLRAAGIHFADNRSFVDAACRDARRLAVVANLQGSGAVLDIGCGAGRLAIGILEELGGIANYDGVDVNRNVVGWGRRHLTRYDARLHFHLLDVQNERYNPSGSEVAAQFTLPMQAASYDAVYSYSVFSHMHGPDVERYLHEIRRLLKSAGIALFTAFVEADVPDEEENPRSYGSGAWEGALHCVRFSRSYFDAMVSRAGLEVGGFEYGQETDGQSLYVVAPRELQ
ncbi:MAG: class I SAM-dependent methyltransferase [Solirubrobacteraceae bacterium]